MESISGRRRRQWQRQQQRCISQHIHFLHEPERIYSGHATQNYSLHTPYLTYRKRKEKKKTPNMPVVNNRLPWLDWFTDTNTCRGWDRLVLRIHWLTHSCRFRFTYSTLHNNLTTCLNLMQVFPYQTPHMDNVFSQSAENGHFDLYSQSVKITCSWRGDGVGNRLDGWMDGTSIIHKVTDWQKQKLNSNKHLHFLILSMRTHMSVSIFILNYCRMWMVSDMRHVNICTKSKRKA